MAVGKVHVGDVNTDFQLLVQDTNVSGVNNPVDLSGTTLRQIVFTDPDGNTTTKTASILNSPGTDGIIRFTNSDAALINVGGFWKYRAKLTFSDGGIFTSNDEIFEVLE